MLTLKKLVLVAACMVCALSASTTFAAAERHLRSAVVQGAVTETFALIAKDSDEDEESAVESTDADESAVMTMETFPLAIESDKYQLAKMHDDDESVEDSFEDSADVSIDDNASELNIEIVIENEDAN